MQLGDFVNLNSGNGTVDDMMVVDVDGDNCTVSWTNENGVKEEMIAPKVCFKHAATP